MSEKRKGNLFTIEEKYEIIKMTQANISYNEIIKKFHPKI